LENIKVLLVEDDMEKKEVIEENLSYVEYINLIGEADSAEEALEALEEHSVDVALVDAYISGDGYQLAEKINANFPETSVIIIEEELREETMHKALFSGARDVLLFPVTPARLVDAIYRSHQMEKKKKSLQKAKPSRVKKSKRQGQILTVFSTKGGVGKTFISTNLAVALSQRGAKVVLVDLDLDFGNSALSLNTIARYTISDVVNEIRNLDQDLMESYLIPHRSGIKLLAADAQPQMTEFINAEHVETILKVLQGLFDYVIVDMPARFHDPVNPAFQLADYLFMVTTPEVATLRNVKSCLNTFNVLKYSRAKIKVLLNKADSRDDIKPKDVEATLNHDLYGVLPAEYRLASSSLNQGIPVVILYPRARISRGFLDLARLIGGQEKQQGRSKVEAAVAAEESKIYREAK